MREKQREKRKEEKQKTHNLVDINGSKIHH
jgi:hypothetical protein